MKFSVVCSPGVGDLLILHIVSHHLVLAGHEVVTITPHRFGKWLSPYRFADELEDSDAIFLQYNNTPRSEAIRQKKGVYTFYGSHHRSKHGPLRAGFDFVADRNRTMVDNIVLALNHLFGIKATPDNGMRPPNNLIHRQFQKRLAIHATSGDPNRNWPNFKFDRFARWARSIGFDPIFLPHFSNLEELSSYIFESGYFLGNDSGPGHLASYLKIPHLVIGREERHMRHWRPGWGGSIITPPRWIPNWKGFRLREKHWKKLILTKSVINKFNDMILNDEFCNIK